MKLNNEIDRKEVTKKKGRKRRELNGVKRKMKKTHHWFLFLLWKRKYALNISILA